MSGRWISGELQKMKNKEMGIGVLEKMKLKGRILQEPAFSWRNDFGFVCLILSNSKNFTSFIMGIWRFELGRPFLILDWI